MSTPATPKVGFVSLGCPKALVDSERILTRLRAEGRPRRSNHGLRCQPCDQDRGADRVMRGILHAQVRLRRHR